MKTVALMLLAQALVCGGVPSDGESLEYMINWPSGLSLGEARLTAKRSGENWNFEMHLDAAVPGFAVADKFVSMADGSLCSLVFERDLQHGKRQSKEKITFDPKGGAAERETVGGGKSKMEVGACAKDALAYLFHMRDELDKRRIPPQQDVYYGSGYRVRLEHKGAQRIRIGDAYENADRLVATIKGPVIALDVELFIGKDEHRTPLLVRIPLKIGRFSVELVR